MMNGEVFARFLNYLDSDPSRAQDQYKNIHQKVANFAEFSGAADGTQVADEALDRCARRLDEGVNVPRPKFEGYARTTAKNICQEQRRADQRTKTAFLTIFANQSDAANKDATGIYRLMKECFKKLLPTEQELLKDYCRIAQASDRVQKRKELATLLELTEVALRLAIWRLRQRLERCLRKKRKFL